MKKYLLIFLLFFTTSCVETIIAGSAATGIVATREKSLKSTKDDILIETKINNQFIIKGLKNPKNKIGVTVNEKRVLLTGLVDDENLIKKANDVVWKISDVKEVIDEIQLTSKKTFFNTTVKSFKDSIITTRVEQKLLFAKNISSNNFEAITVNQIVYLIGVAKNQLELKQVNDLAATVSGVKKVISHITLSKNQS